MDLNTGFLEDPEVPREYEIAHPDDQGRRLSASTVNNRNSAINQVINNID